jgi:hypothetical protein
MTRGTFTSTVAGIGATPSDLTAAADIFPLIYWNIISHQTHQYAHWNMEQKYLKNINQIITGVKWTYDWEIQEGHLELSDKYGFMYLSYVLILLCIQQAIMHQIPPCCH